MTSKISPAAGGRLRLRIVLQHVSAWGVMWSLSFFLTLSAISFPTAVRSMEVDRADGTSGIPQVAHAGHARDSMLPFAAVLATTVHPSTTSEARASGAAGAAAGGLGGGRAVHLPHAENEVDASNATARTGIAAATPVQASGAAPPHPNKGPRPPPGPRPVAGPKQKKYESSAPGLQPVSKTRERDDSPCPNVMPGTEQVMLHSFAGPLNPEAEADVPSAPVAVVTQQKQNTTKTGTPRGTRENLVAALNQQEHITGAALLLAFEYDKEKDENSAGLVAVGPQQQPEAEAARQTTPHAPDNPALETTTRSRSREASGPTTSGGFLVAPHRSGMSVAFADRTTRPVPGSTAASRSNTSNSNHSTPRSRNASSSAYPGAFAPQLEIHHSAAGVLSAGAPAGRSSTDELAFALKNLEREILSGKERNMKTGRVVQTRTSLDATTDMIARMQQLSLQASKRRALSASATRSLSAKFGRSESCEPKLEGGGTIPEGTPHCNWNGALNVFSDDEETPVPEGGEAGAAHDGGYAQRFAEMVAAAAAQCAGTDAETTVGAGRQGARRDDATTGGGDMRMEDAENNIKREHNRSEDADLSFENADLFLAPLPARRQYTAPPSFEPREGLGIGDTGPGRQCSAPSSCGVGSGSKRFALGGGSKESSSAAGGGGGRAAADELQQPGEGSGLLRPSSSSERGRASALRNAMSRVANFAHVGHGGGGNNKAGGTSSINSTTRTSSEKGIRPVLPPIAGGVERGVSNDGSSPGGSLSCKVPSTPRNKQSRASPISPPAGVILRERPIVEDRPASVKSCWSRHAAADAARREQHEEERRQNRASGSLSRASTPNSQESTVKQLLTSSPLHLRLPADEQDGQEHIDDGRSAGSFHAFGLLSRGQPPASRDLDSTLRQLQRSSSFGCLSHDVDAPPGIEGPSSTASLVAGGPGGPLCVDAGEIAGGGAATARPPPGGQDRAPRPMKTLGVGREQLTTPRKKADVLREKKGLVDRSPTGHSRSHIAAETARAGSK